MLFTQAHNDDYCYYGKRQNISPITMADVEDVEWTENGKGLRMIC